ncbi:MAG: FtsX-like permease family protein [Anaerolineales bacterium]
MNRPRFHKVIADLWGNRVRSVLVVASISIGLFAIGVISTLHLVLTGDMSSGYAAVNPANIRIGASPLTDDMIEHLQRIPGIRQAVGVERMNLRLEASPGEWIAIEIKAVEDPAENAIDQVRLLSGKWPPADREIAIDEYKLSDTNANVGDTVRIELPSGTVRALKLVGVIQDQTIGSSGIAAGFFLAPVQGYISMDTAEWLEAPPLYNAANLTVDGDATDEEYLWQVAKRVRHDLESNGIQVFSTSVRSPYDHPNKTFVDAVVVVLLLLGALIVFLSGFLITNTLQALLTQQREQIGIMKTVGGRRRQVAGVYMGMIFLLGLVAFAVSAPLAHEVAYRLAEYLATEINFALGSRRLIPAALALQAALALFVPQIAGVWPIWQGSRVSVRQALSGFRVEKGGHEGWLSRQLARFSGIPRPILISFRNVFRNRARLILTLVTLSLGGAIFIATFNVRLSLQKHTDNISRYFIADVNVTTDRPQRVDEVQATLSALPQVSEVEGWATARSELVLADGAIGESVQLVAPPAESDLVEPIVLAGRWIQPGDQNAVTLSERFTDTFPDMKVGDTLRLQVAGEEYDWVVVGFFQLAGKSGGYLAYTSYQYLSQLVGRPNQATDFRVVSNRPNLTRSEQDQLGTMIEDQLESRGISVREVSAGESMHEIASDGFAILTAFLLFLAILTALVGSIGLTGTMSLNVMERTREIGVMRAIGASNKILVRMVLVEGVTMGLLSWLMGSALAIPISKLMGDGVSRALFDAPSTFVLTFTGFGLWLLVVALLSGLASVMPALSAARLTIREVLAYE